MKKKQERGELPPKIQDTRPDENENLLAIGQSVIGEPLLSTVNFASPMVVWTHAFEVTLRVSRLLSFPKRPYF